jgi:uridine kinase
MLFQRAIKLHSLTEKRRVALGYRLREPVAPVVVGISGGSYSGKRSFCRGLKALLNADEVVFLSETLYRLSPSIEPNSDGTVASLDISGPDTFDFERLLSHLEDLIAGNPVFVSAAAPAANFRSDNWKLISPTPIIVVEGEFLFENPELLRKLDFKVLIDVPAQTRAERIVAAEKAKGNLPLEWDAARVLERLLPMHLQYVESRRALADAVVSGENPFEPWLMDLGARVIDELMARRRR